VERTKKPANGFAGRMGEQRNAYQRIVTPEGSLSIFPSVIGFRVSASITATAFKRPLATERFLPSGRSTFSFGFP
jgi:hypothetical protein